MTILLLISQPRGVSQMVLASSDILTHMLGDGGGIPSAAAVQNVHIPMPAHRCLPHFHTELTLPRQSLLASLHQGSASHTFLQVKRGDSSNPSVPTELRYSVVSYANHFRNLLEDGDVTASKWSSLETGPGDNNDWGG